LGGFRVDPDQSGRRSKLLDGNSLMKLRRTIYRIALGLACALPTIAHAAVVYDEIIYQDASGTILASVIATPAEIAANPNAFFYLPGVDFDATQIGNYGDIVDAAGNPIELFGIANGGPDGNDLAFTFETNAAAEPVQNPVMATGAPISMTMYLSPALQAAGNTASLIVSSTSSAVPEPITWALMVVGFAAIGCGLRSSAPVRRNALA
jgi:hypothetical protein